MAIPTYLAMTAAEFTGCSQLPHHIAWMACHFSPYAIGLSNFPSKLPENSMLIINDIMPVHMHHPEIITEQMLHYITQHRCSAVLLDFQRPPDESVYAIAKSLCSALPCPTGVSEQLAIHLDCPVFLSPCPFDCTLQNYLKPWMGREVWMEISTDKHYIQITENGTTTSNDCDIQINQPVHFDASLCCHYQINVEKNRISFCLWRNQEDIRIHLEEAEHLGITKAIGLYQQLHNIL